MLLDNDKTESDIKTKCFGHTWNQPFLRNLHSQVMICATAASTSLGNKAMGQLLLHAFHLIYWKDYQQKS